MEHRRLVCERHSPELAESVPKRAGLPFPLSAEKSHFHRELVSGLQGELHSTRFPKWPDSKLAFSRVTIQSQMFARSATGTWVCGSVCR